MQVLLQMLGSSNVVENTLDEGATHLLSLDDKAMRTASDDAVSTARNEDFFRVMQAGNASAVHNVQEEIIEQETAPLLVSDGSSEAIEFLDRSEPDFLRDGVQIARKFEALTGLMKVEARNDSPKLVAPIEQEPTLSVRLDSASEVPSPDSKPAPAQRLMPVQATLPAAKPTEITADTDGKSQSQNLQENAKPKSIQPATTEPRISAAPHTTAPVDPVDTGAKVLVAADTKQPRPDASMPKKNSNSLSNSQAEPASRPSPKPASEPINENLIRTTAHADPLVFVSRKPTEPPVVRGIEPPEHVPLVLPDRAKGSERRSDRATDAIERAMSAKTQPVDVGGTSMPAPRTADEKSAPTVPSVAVDKLRDLASRTVDAAPDFANTERKDAPHLSRPAGQVAVEPAARPVAPQIVQAIQRSASDGFVEVRLQPEELGHVRMKISHAETGLNVEFSAERAETADLIRRNIEFLASELRGRGFAGLSFSFEQEQQDNRESFGHRTAEGDADVLPPEETQIEVNLAAAQLPGGGVDIRI